MVNAGSLLYEELNGTMNKTYPIKTNIMSEETRVTPQESDEYDPIITVGSGNTASAEYVNFDLNIDNVSIDTSNYDTLDFSTIEFPEGMSVNYDMNPDLCYMEPGTVLKTDDSPFSQNFLADNDDSVAHHFESVTLNTTNFQGTPSIEKQGCHKYEEDKSIKALQDYVSTTYNSHYTSDKNDVQTLDLIESVGDGEAFCRSNAIKYLSRYDKKGQAKRDILKALHYTLLLYYFSGNTKENETPTRGYETF